MINLDEIIGDVIFISFGDNERFREIGIKISSGHFILKGYDQLGLWLEHPGIIIQHMEDDQGKPLPSERQSLEEINAIFMVNVYFTWMKTPGRRQRSIITTAAVNCGVWQKHTMSCITMFRCRGMP